MIIGSTGALSNIESNSYSLRDDQSNLCSKSIDINLSENILNLKLNNNIIPELELFEKEATRIQYLEEASRSLHIKHIISAFLNRSGVLLVHLAGSAHVPQPNSAFNAMFSAPWHANIMVIKSIDNGRSLEIDHTYYNKPYSAANFESFDQLKGRKDVKTAKCFYNKLGDEVFDDEAAMNDVLNM
jgi:hypothetical protein